MVNRPDSSSTRSDKSSSSTRSSMKKNNNIKNTFVRSKSGNDYKEKNGTQNRLRNASSLQSISKASGNQTNRGMKKFKSNGSVDSTDIGVKSSGSSTPLEDNINVVVRVRPLSEKEVKASDDSIVQFPGNGQILCEGQNDSQKPKLFTYNVVFEPGATQEDIVQYCGIKRLIEMAIEGFSSTVFCYGQTGSGKTHTLTGPPQLFVGKKPDLNHKDHGLIFRSFFYLFQLLQQRQENTQFILKASFLEIYNEKVIDLLNPGAARKKPLAVRWSKKMRGFYVENLFLVDCEELDDLLAVLEEGMRNRAVGSHLMNDHSSRSHTILTVHITSEQQAENEKSVFISKQGKINFVDLAGSEMTKKTQSEGKTLEEANNINKSLMVLGYCIASLADSKKRSGHIPYRDSQLTKLLADSLAGNGVTLMIACISPAKSNQCETINTLRYAARAKKIKTKPLIIIDPREALILSLKREVNALKLENEHLKSLSAFHMSPRSGSAQINGNNDRSSAIVTPKIDVERLAELENNELSELVKLYMTENQSLRQENNELYTTKDILLRDQELVSRENERLLKKLEDVNSVCCRSPIIPARPTMSGDVFNFSTNSDTDITNSNYWRNPLNASSEFIDGRMSSAENKISDSVQKEMDKMRISDSITTVAGSLRRNKSFDRNGQPITDMIT
ncbi:CLUMA_CG001829, isoform A [Clunio marinus]|uniref:Kinesin-like protein n=1 Tax=Clunio marinus TaxID=568069 RepID=A0A1J1HJG0_9DIPT|nr:CLUMA_CG001829, isoform A [Clunio marinus]